MVGRAMRVVLLQTAPWRPDMPALGLPYVAAALRAAGHAAVIVDVNLPLYEAATRDERRWWEPANAWAWQRGSTLDAFLARNAAVVDRVVSSALASAAPPLVGITMLATQKPFALWLAARVRVLRPDSRVVVGGPQCFAEYEPASIVADSSVDFVVQGEGEFAAVELCDWLDAGGLGEPPPAIWCHDGRRGASRPLESDIDRIAHPDFTGLPLSRYTDAGRLPIFTSRGCVRRCVFCIEQRIWERFRYRTAPNVFAEMKRGVELHGATKFEFNDSLFNGHMRVLGELCDLILADGMRVSWGGQGIIRAEMSPRMLAKLNSAGCGFITYGFESASQHVLDAMKKNVDMAVASRVVRDTHAAGIGQKLNLMFGFPGEREEDFQATLDFLTENAAFIDEVNPSDAFTAIIPGTELYERAASFGVTNLANAWFWEADGGANDFAERLDRFERLCRHVKALGIRSTYRYERVANRHQVLGDFSLYKGRLDEARDHYRHHAREIGVAPEQLPNWAAAFAGGGGFDLSAVAAGTS